MVRRRHSSSSPALLLLPGCALAGAAALLAAAGPWRALGAETDGEAAQAGPAHAEPGSAEVLVDVTMRWIATAIEVAGVAVIVAGVLAATLMFVRAGLGAVGWAAAYHRYRANLGRGILLGLELLVAADIVGTVAVTPSFESLAVLAMIVLIRTFLSFSLEVEIEGRWPWRRGEDEARMGGERV